MGLGQHIDFGRDFVDAFQLRPIELLSILLLKLLALELKLINWSSRIATYRAAEEALSVAQGLIFVLLRDDLGKTRKFACLLHQLRNSSFGKILDKLIPIKVFFCVFFYPIKNFVESLLWEVPIASLGPDRLVEIGPNFVFGK